MLFFLVILLSFSSGSLKAKVSFLGSKSTLAFQGAHSKLQLNRVVEGVAGIIKLVDTDESSVFNAGLEPQIHFEGGLLQTKNASTAISGCLDFSVEPQWQLQNKKVRINRSVNESILVKGAGNVLSGRPILTSPIVLEDGQSELGLRLQGELDQSVILNNGKLILESDLRLQDNVFFAGSGTINVNNYSLVLPNVSNEAWTGTLNFENAQEVVVPEVYTIQSGTWAFTTGSPSYLRGRGGIVDMSGGGIIQVNASHTLYIFGLHLKGLGDSPRGRFVFGSTSTSLIYLSGVTLDLTADLTITGRVFIFGHNCKIFSRNGSKLIISGATAQLSVDRCIFEYDNRSNSIADYPIQTTGGGQVLLTNGGQIRSANSLATNGWSGFDIATASGVNRIASNLDLGQQSRLFFTNYTGSAKTMTFDAGGNTLRFNAGSSACMEVAAQTTLLMQNTIVDGFDPALVSRLGSGGSQAVVNFGAGTTLRLDKNLTVSAEIPFVGSAVFDGAGRNVILTAADSLTVTGGSTLELRNMRIYTQNLTALRIKDSSSKIIFNNCELIIDNNNLTLSQGAVDILGLSAITGVHAVNADSKPRFTWASTGNVVVKSKAELRLGPNLNFRYAPNTSGDGGVLSVQRRHFVLEALDSSWDLGFVELEVGPQGLAIDRGIMRLSGDLDVRRDVGQTNSALVLGSALSVQPGNNTLGVDGPLFYSPSS